VSCHTVFLEHIPFFSIPSITHSLTRSNLIHINHFYEDSNSLSSQVPSTLNTPPHVRQIWIDHSTTNTLLSRTPEALFSSMVPPTVSKIVDLPLHQSIHIHKSTKLGRQLEMKD
jgi:hypothetical protein